MKFAGEREEITGEGEISFKLEDYLDDEEESTLVVEASNDVGPAIKEVVLTRDDDADGLPNIPEDLINDTIYQAFYWESYEDLWTELPEMAEDFSSLGITAMWLPPAAKASGVKDEGYNIYDIWDLGEFDQQGAVETRYGTRDELEVALDALDEVGIDAYFDVVFNHRVGGEPEEVQLNYDRTVYPYTQLELQGRQEYYSKANQWSWNWEEFNGTDWCSQIEEDHPDGRGYIYPRDYRDGGYPALFAGKSIGNIHKSDRI